MPNYEYECQSCNHAFVEQLKISDMDKPLNEKCPKCSKENSIKRNVTGGFTGDPVLLGVKKPPPEFTNRLKKIQRDYPDAKGIKIR